MGKVYIILVNWNGYEDTIECIKSIQENHYQDYNIIVVDNNSKNDSVSKISNWAMENKTNLENLKIKQTIDNNLKEKNRTVFLIENDENTGFANANNLGIKFALKDEMCRYIWVLNNDTVIDKNAIKAMIKTIEENYNVGMVGAKLMYYYEDMMIQEVYGEVVWKDNGKGIGNKEIDKGQLDKDIEIRQGRIMGASMFMPREAIESVGLMDESYFMEYEDTAWCMEFYKCNYRLFYSYRAVVYHKEGGTIKENENEKRRVLGKMMEIEPPLKFLIHSYYSFRNNIYFTRKYFKKDFYKYFFMILPKKFVYYMLKAIANKKYRNVYIRLVVKAVLDGLRENMGKTIDPVKWKKRYKGRNS